MWAIARVSGLGVYQGQGQHRGYAVGVMVMHELVLTLVGRVRASIGVMQ